MTKTASLSPGLVAVKGRAEPSVAPEQKPVRSSLGTEYHKALTVKLDKQRYKALKTAGVQLDKSSQEMFVEALDIYLARINAP